MSVLHDRIMTQGQAGPEMHPVSTPATPMVMPAAEYHYNREDFSARYGTPEPYWTADVNAAPIAARDFGTWGRVAPAGRP